MAFQDTIGHTKVIELLRRALVNQKVSHAYLFVGPESVGKKFVAVQFAKALNCHEQSGDSCGECRSCKKFATGNHPDFKLIQPENNIISIGQIRELQKEILYRPYESLRKVYIIDEAHLMTPEGANSLLKTLEEPPPYAVIILITPRKDGILPTLISRCQIIQFSRLSKDEIESFLLKNVSGKSDMSDFEDVILLAEGSAGLALNLLGNTYLTDIRKKILPFLLQLGQKTNLEIFELIQSLGMESDPGQWDSLLKIIKTFYRDLIILKTTKNCDMVINKNYLESMQQIKSQYSLEDLEKVIKIIERTNNVIMTNVDKELAFEVMLHKIKARRM